MVPTLQPAADAADDDNDEPADDDGDDEYTGCPDRFPERGVRYELGHRYLPSESRGMLPVAWPDFD